MATTGTTGNLPPGWTAGQAEDGSTFYINHASKTTTWEHPTTAAALPAFSGVNPAAVAPTTVYPAGSTASVEHPHVTATSGSCPATPLGCCSFLDRRFFWIGAGLTWVVWIFSVASAGDNNWSLMNGKGSGIVDRNSVCGTIYENSDACAAYKAFVATQIISTLMISVATVVYTVAFFRPFEAQLGSTKVLGLVGGILTALGTFFQMLAFIVADIWVQENIEGSVGSYERGPTFGVGVTTFVFGFIQSIIVLLSFSSAGDGPLLPLARQLSILNKPPVQAHPLQTQAMMEQGTQSMTGISRSTQNEANTQQGAIPVPLPQPNNEVMPPPPEYDSDDLEAKPPQSNVASKGPPPAYDNVDVGSSST